MLPEGCDKGLRRFVRLSLERAGSKRFSPGGKKEKREGREGEGSIRFRRAKRAGNATGGGQIIDASIVSAPKQHNSREENETIKEGKTPEDWKQKPAKNRQKDARWTKKHERSYYGYKNHIGVDRRHKFVRCYVVSDASLHDSQTLEDVLDTPPR